MRMQQADMVPVAELLKQQLEKVGIRVDIEAVTASLFDQRKTSNEIMASLLWNDGPAWASGISEDYLPNDKGPWSPATWQYFTSGGKKGRKPPANIEEFYKLHTERKKYPPESPEGQQAFQKLMQWIAGQLRHDPHGRCESVAECRGRQPAATSRTRTRPSIWTPISTPKACGSPSSNQRSISSHPWVARPSRPPRA